MSSGLTKAACLAGVGLLESHEEEMRTGNEQERMTTRDRGLDLSVVIVTWNVADRLMACLESLGPALKDLSHEIILVDNASRDGTVEVVRKRFPQVTLIVNTANAGFAAAVNQALGLAQGLKATSRGWRDFQQEEAESGAESDAADE